MKELTSAELSQVAEIELSYRNVHPAAKRPKINSAEDAALLLRSMWDDNKIELLEQVKLLLLDRDMRCLGVSDIASGWISGCIVDPKIVYAIALKAKASGLILAHNHPSGNIAPSKADRQLTEKLQEAGKVLDIAFHDHLIITRDGFSSYERTWDCFPSPA